MSSATAQYTDFSKDILGRYVCNGLDEAMASTLGGGRPFDIVIIGGGSFGSALAQHLLYSDMFHAHRILVLEAGPFILAEHTQNLPTLGLYPPPPAQTDPGPRAEVWGLPWVSNDPVGFPGLAYCIGGRSLFWGGWSPQLLDIPSDTEMPRDRWPEVVVDDLNSRFFAESAEQIGVTASNDFVFGKMHQALRKLLFKGVGNVPAAVPLQDIPPHLNEQKRPNISPAKVAELNLEAPLAVQGRADRSGFFPMNKFSGVPLLMRAARQAYMEAPGNDSAKRLMVVPNCHVTFLETAMTNGVGQVTRVHTNHDSPQWPGIPLPDRGVVVLAAGTIESTRLALLSFQGAIGYELIGANLMAHMRSNYSVLMQRAVVNVPPGDLQGSAMFLKCHTTHADGSVSHFHLQITAAGLKGLTGNSDGELYQLIPDIDTIDAFRQADEDHIAMTVRGVAEIQPGNPDNGITLSGASDEFGMRRALVSFGDPRSKQSTPGESQQTANDRETWQVMDDTSDLVLAQLTNPANIQTTGRNRDGLGTTHHESGTLRMGVDPIDSMTTPNARFHNVVNAYAIGPALLPSMGSPNPMLSGVALARRLAEHLVAPLAPPALEPGFAWLFDGTPASFQQWAQAGPGSVELVQAEGVMVAHPGNDIGLLFYGAQAFGDFVLRLQFRLEARDDNSGVFVRFRDPRLPAPDLNDPRTQTNPAWIAVDSGYELQIDDTARPDGADMHRTGAVYAIDVGPAPGQQVFHRGSALQPGEWNDYEIEVAGDLYTVGLNGLRTSTFSNTTAGRGGPVSQNPNSGFIGLQTHTGQVAFRAVRIRT